MPGRCRHMASSAHGARCVDAPSWTAGRIRPRTAVARQQCAVAAGAVALAVAAVVILVLATWGAAASVSFIPPPRNELLAACRRFATPHFGLASLLAVALGGLAVAVFLRGSRSAWRQIRATRRLVGRPARCHHGPEMTVRATHGAINARSERQRAYTKILTVMRRLAAKGLLERRRSGRTDHYRPLLTASEYAATRARMGAGALVEEFGDAALAHFALTLAKLDPARRAELERLAEGG